MINLNEVLKTEPSLTPFGIEDPNKFDIKDQKFDAEKIKQIETCVDWLKSKKLQKNFNKRTSSYGIKHIIEREQNTYIANGCFIAAVIKFGIPYKRKDNSPNIFVPISDNELYKNDPKELGKKKLVTYIM